MSGSTKTGTCPALIMALMVAIYVLDGTMISEPSGKSNAIRGNSKAFNPDATPRNLPHPKYAANDCSNVSTFFPKINQPRFNTSSNDFLYSSENGSFRK